MTKSILVFSGSARRESFNKRLAAIAATSLTKAGAAVTLIDLAQYPAPIYNGDIETDEGIPAKMQELRELIAGHKALFISSPEYNGCVSPLLMNVFAWTSRPDGDVETTAAYQGKKAAIAATSPGDLGGIRVVPRLRDVMAELGITTIPGFLTVGSAYDNLSSDDAKLGEQPQGILDDLAARLVASIS